MLLLCVYGRRKEDGNVVGLLLFYTDYAGSRPTFLRKDFTSYQTTRCQYLPYINLDSHQLSFCIIIRPVVVSINDLAYPNNSVFDGLNPCIY
jgi:hypothetical protein